MKLTQQDFIEVQTALDAQYERTLATYNNLIATGFPAWLLAKPERILLTNTPSQFTKTRGANIRPHYGK